VLGHCDEASRRCYVDDLATLSRFHHPPSDRLGEEEGRSQVDVELRIPPLDRHVE
jgi:hypothetical protein